MNTVARWLGVDDGPKSGVEWRYEQVRDPESTLATVGIRIEKLEVPHAAE